MNLLIDMGNTRLKWAVTTGGQIMIGSPLLNTRINRYELIDLWKGIYRPKRLAVSCVSANQLLELVQSVARELWLDIDIIMVKPQAQAFGVINAYQQPEKLGVDRWLSLVAVWGQYHSPACIVDCGTAITVDLIDADGRHQGGLISPGLALMKKSLGLGTVALSVSETNHPFDRPVATFPPSLGVGRMDSLPIATLLTSREGGNADDCREQSRSPSMAVGLADFTEGAIYSGILMAAIGLIEHVLAKQPEYRQLILTGGDAELIAGQLAVASIVDPDLVLRGLLCVLEGHA